MKQLFCYLLIGFLLSACPAHAQFLKRMGDRIEEKVNDRLNQKADEAIDKGLDKTEEGLSAQPKDNVGNPGVANDAIPVHSAAKGDCGNFYLLTRHKLVQMTVYDKNNQPALTMDYHIQKVESTASGKTSYVLIDAYDENGKKMTTANAVYKCVDGTLLMDMKASMPYQEGQQSQMQAQGEEHRAFLQYPPDMSVGQTLPNAHFTMNMQQQNSIVSSATISTTKRKVEAREKVTTPAGSWNCFRISYTAKTQVAFMSLRYQVTEWFAPGYGVVKSVSRNKKGKIAGHSELTKVQ